MSDTQPAAAPSPSDWSCDQPDLAAVLVSSRARVLETGKQVAQDVARQVAFFDGALAMLGAQVGPDGQLGPAPKLADALAPPTPPAPDPHANVDPELAPPAPASTPATEADPTTAPPAPDAYVEPPADASPVAGVDAPAPVTDGAPVDDTEPVAGAVDPTGGDAWLPAPADEPATDAPPVQ